ncbi:MAG: DNA mismatch repair endonuclease MutL [Bacteroidales bacterium]
MLKILPPQISNLIAAGEVVQRPASALKELIENAIDAGASNIVVNISDSGKTLIQVIDDGSGMSETDAVLCFARHATSKISSADDLDKIRSYGFRGEALPSIAAVADVSIKTRRKEDEVGTEVVYCQSGLVSQEPISCPVGTNISIRNIFYNIPARRKFLRSDAAEFRHIVTEFVRIVLCHHDIKFMLNHNKKNVYLLPAVPNLKQRIVAVGTKDIIKNIVDINVETSIVKLTGFIGKPENAHKRLGHQFFFVNGRFFKSPYFHKAVTKAYENLIPSDYNPSYYIYFETNPETIDFNIHPSKTEVKFEEESAIFQILHSAVREGIGMNALGPSIDFDTEGSPEIPMLPKKGQYVPPPKVDYDPLFNPFKEEELFIHNYQPANNIVDPLTSMENGYGAIFEEKMDSKNLLIIKNKYIITPVKSGILMIHIARSKERIFYERILASLDNFNPIIQTSLFPIKIQLEKNAYSILMSDTQKLKLLGFDIRPSENDDEVEIFGLPEGFTTENDSVSKSIDELIDILSDMSGESLENAGVREKVARKLAKSGASSSSENLNLIEAQLLVDTLFICREPDRAPDGKKCMTIISINELERYM